MDRVCRRKVRIDFDWATEKELSKHIKKEKVLNCSRFRFICNSIRLVVEVIRAKVNIVGLDKTTVRSNARRLRETDECEREHTK
jgi:hypothetical protein